MQPRCLIAAAALLPALAFAQAHIQRHGGYTLRSSTVASTAIDPRTARKHGIEPAADRAVLNVLVQRGEGRRLRTVPAEVRASARNLAGMERDIRLREARADNGDISYVGTYTHAAHEVLDLTVHARPTGSNQQLSLRYRQRLPGG